MQIRTIYLSWRPGIGHRRFLIGELRRNYVEGLSFQYIPEGLKAAEKEGLTHYPGLPYDPDKIFRESDGIDILFKKRVIDYNRPDKGKLLEFWEATDADYDYFDLLALTQGWMPTDNFEFLGLYYPKPGMSFVTDLANVRDRKLTNEDVEGFTTFRYKKEPDNEFDENAVLILNNAGDELGYIKVVHNRFFYKLRGLVPTITLKAVESNDYLKRIFICVSIKD